MHKFLDIFVPVLLVVSFLLAVGTVVMGGLFLREASEVGLKPIIERIWEGPQNEEAKN